MAFLISDFWGGGRSISLMYEWPLAIILHLRSTYKRWSWVFVATTFSECHQIRPDNSVESDFKAAQIAPYLLLPAQWVQWSLVLHDGRAMVGSKKTPLQPCFAPCALQKSVKTLTIRSAHPMHRIKLCAAANITSRNTFFDAYGILQKLKCIQLVYLMLESIFRNIWQQSMIPICGGFVIPQTFYKQGCVIFTIFFINWHNFHISIQNVFIVYKMSFLFQVIIGSGYQVPLYQNKKGVILSVMIITSSHCA